MFKGTKRFAALFALIAVFACFILSGCTSMMGGSGGTIDGGTGEAAPPAESMLTGILPLIAIVAIFYFLMIRPQSKKNKQINEMRSKIKRGDRVTTIGGFKARVVRVKDDVITIEVGSDKTKMDIMNWGISKVDEVAPESKGSGDKDDEDLDAEEEQPKRKPRKLTVAAKKEPEGAGGGEAEETETEGIAGEDSQEKDK